MRAWRLALPAFLLALPGAVAEPDAERPWYVNRYNEVLRDWKPEAETTIEVQEYPNMVIWEVTRYPDGEQTAEQKEAAEALLRATRESAELHGWFDYDRAVEDGYELLALDEVHYFNLEYCTDGRTLDPERPEFLMYYDSPQGGKELVGVMYLTSELEARGPQIGGGETVWHYHVWSHPLCLLEGIVVGGSSDLEGRCEEGIPSSRSAEMLHLWFVDHPEGPYATSMRLEPWVLKRYLDDRAAARKQPTERPGKSGDTTKKPGTQY